MSSPSPASKSDYVVFFKSNDVNKRYCGVIIEPNLVITPNRILSHLSKIPQIYLDYEEQQNITIYGNLSYPKEEHVSSNDISMIKLNTNTHRTPIKIGTQVAKNCTSLSYSKNGTKIIIGEEPQEIIDKKDIPKRICEENSTKEENELENEEEIFASEDKIYTKFTNCKIGDTILGFPLICCNELQGLLSYGPFYRSGSYYAVWTSVPYHLSWINNNKNKIAPFDPVTPIIPLEPFEITKNIDFPKPPPEPPSKSLEPPLAVPLKPSKPSESLKQDPEASNAKKKTSDYLKLSLASPKDSSESPKQSSGSSKTLSESKKVPTEKKPDLGLVQEPLKINGTEVNNKTEGVNSTLSMTLATDSNKTEVNVTLTKVS